MDVAVKSDGRWARCALPRGGWLDCVETLHGRAGFWWLDSALPGAPLGRWSYAGAEPWAELRAWGDRIQLDVHRAVHPRFPVGRTEQRGDPLQFAEDMLRELAPAGPAGPDLPFAGGAVGWLGYELCPFTEGYVSHADDDLGLPDLCLLWVDRLIAIEHLEGPVTACVAVWGATDPEAELSRFVAALQETPRREGEASWPEAGGDSPEKSVRQIDRQAHEKAVHRIQDAVAGGDVYQACLTRRVTVPFCGDPWLAYRFLRARNPAPFGAYLELPGLALLSSSPERFLELTPDGRAESRPIKGTRPRGASPREDAALARELGASEKDRAENVMITDLVRNDLGRVCEIGSVHVSELQVIERYANVWQMVSTVRGRLRPDVGPLDLVRATFPPGSMTGAPKRAALRILDGIEPVRRGPYSGALGWLDPRGSLSLSVVIRTAIVHAGRAHVHTGGGIVADSDAADEWCEAAVKARVLLECVAAAAAASAGSGAATEGAGS
jgi:aminodeoxychorismate synthase component I